MSTRISDLIIIMIIRSSQNLQARNFIYPRLIHEKSLESVKRIRKNLFFCQKKKTKKRFFQNIKKLEISDARNPVCNFAESS